jgi:hypothetical protein
VSDPGYEDCCEDCGYRVASGDENGISYECVNDAPCEDIAGEENGGYTGGFPWKAVALTPDDGAIGEDNANL